MEEKGIEDEGPKPKVKKQKKTEFPENRSKLVKIFTKEEEKK